MDTSGSTISVIQMKDLGHDNNVNFDDLMGTAMESVKEHHLVQKGDLVFRSRGQVTTSAIVVEAPIKSIVAAPLLRIRVTSTETILPEYLNWYINQKEAQAFLVSRAKGTTVKMISKNTIGELEVMVPPMALQKKIVELDSLSSREQYLLTTLAKKRKQIIETQLLQFIKGEKRHDDQ